MPGSPNPASPALTRDSARFRGTRAAHRDEIGEDYVEAIAQIAHERPTGPPPRVKDLAAMMGVSHVTVVRTVARLAERGLLTAGRGTPITLTPKGIALAKRVQARHQTVLDFLLAIGVPPKQAAIDAEGIEHHVSEATIRAMLKYVKTRSR